MIRISLPLWLKHKLYGVPPGDGLIPLPPMPGAVVHAEARPRSNSVLADIVGYLGRKATSLLYPVRLPEPLHSELMEKFRATEKALLHSLRDVPQKDKGFCSPDERRQLRTAELGQDRLSQWSLSTQGASSWQRTSWLSNLLQEHSGCQAL